MRAGTGHHRSLRSRPWRARVVLLILVLGTATVAWADDPQGDPTATTPTTEQVLAQRAALEDQLAAARARSAEPAGEAEGAARDVELLERLDLVLEQQLAALAERTERETALQAAEDELRALRENGLSDPPPYRLRQLDEALEEQASFAQRVDAAAAAVDAATEALEEARKSLASRERARREAKDATDAVPDGSRSPADTALRPRQLRSRAAAELVTLRALELENARLVRRTQEAGAEQRALRVQLLAAGAHFTEEELREQLAGIDEREASLRRELAAAKKELAVAERQWVTAQRQAEQVGAPDATAIAAARRLTLQTRQLAVTTLAQGIQRLGEARELWQRRLAVTTGAEKRPQLTAWAEEVRHARDELVRQERLQQNQIAELNAERRKLESDLEVAASNTRSERAQVEELAAQTRLRERALAGLEESQRLHERALAELDAALATVSIAQRFGDAWSELRAAWRYELFAIDDRPITVGRVAIGALLLVVGLLFSGFLSRLVGRRLLPRLGLEAGAAAAFETLLYYGFVVALVLLALRTVNFPLTAFTLLGGAARDRHRLRQPERDEQLHQRA